MSFASVPAAWPSGGSNGFLLAEALLALLVLVMAAMVLEQTAAALHRLPETPVHSRIETQWFYDD